VSAMIRTRLTELTGIRYPIVQTGMVDGRPDLGVMADGPVRYGVRFWSIWSRSPYPL
jgi:hypothetical protein